MKRISESFHVMVNGSEQYVSRQFLARAMSDSDKLLANLLEEAGSRLDRIHPSFDGDAFCTLMMVILWQPCDSLILVHGHASTSEIATNLYDYKPAPILTTVACPGDQYSNLPNRYDSNPKAKLTSWCRRRHILEEELQFEGVGEVLLGQKVYNEIYLLEGLTSNLFFIYPGGILRTAGDESVLNGYARHSVLDCAKKCGLQVDIGPIPWSDASLWEEVFLTSAVRLVIPVREIQCVDKNSDGVKVMRDRWSQNLGTNQQIWRSIYNEMHFREMSPVES